MREVWRRKIIWDEPLPDDITSAWRNWQREVRRTAAVRIQRFYFNEGTPKSLQLHVFVDASEEAFAAVCYWRLKRTTAWMFKFIDRTRCSRSLSVSPSSVSTVYGVEVKLLKDGQMVPKESPIYNLLPHLDAKSVMRPPKHRVTVLIVAYYHCKMKHQNIEATIGEIRQKCWVMNLRQVLRKVANGCMKCKVSRSKPATPIMGPLPQDRFKPYVRPFSYTGLDYFGPLKVTIGRRTEKRWVALFTCLTVRAIHLEAAYDLSTDACILAIRNFINRRGVPVRLRSDNGKNFVGADQEAKRFDEVFDCGRVSDELSSKGIGWIFNCPQNPSESGI
ncbi:PREDICTED: uncharacterized protein LOC108360633 [Rhagoletis zephyria]|uniref:uncharacterized protein LOC108360633 n=1 Tax=Rhagoletis zephyria TaxID=28612 RepID=UPI0008118E73|nr:PREDICTED: uncharacterized protein LOC108360633 [Rhagoletis zephyria]XP_036322258.1 uncharacterized protein LOC118736271 [Rhagoletis pomonella]